jgi:hypothetical protein
VGDVANEPDEQEPMQETPAGDERDDVGLPGEGGTAIPVPRRVEVLAALRKVAKPRSAGGDSGPEE